MVYIAPIGNAGGTNVVNKISAWVIDLLLDIKLCKDTTIANRGLCRELSNSKIYYYSKVCWYLLLGSTALPRVLITQTTCEGRFKALFLTTFLLMVLHLCSIVEGSLLHVARITRARLTASGVPTLTS